MDFFFGSASQEAPDASQTIDKLCDRVKDATLLEDRRSAVQGLRALARDWQLQVGTKGMPVLIKVLKTDRMDTEILKLTLETLNVLCGKRDRRPDDPQGQPEDLGGMLSEIFVKDPSNIALLLDILAEVEFYVRYTTITLLTTLLESVGDFLHDSILASPMGISRLIDLLDDRREIIRNEGLLLLIKLSGKNADIQKIVAFESAFERLFSIIVEEGSIDGGIIVQDCFLLMQNLLRHNASNQNLFRETSCIKQVPKMLLSRKSLPKGAFKELPLSDPSVSWTEQKETNTVYVIELVRILVEGSNQNTSINQNLLAQANIIDTLLGLAIETLLPLSIRVKSLLAIGDLIRQNEVNRDRLSNCIVSMSLKAEASGLPSQKGPPGVPTSGDFAIVQLALGKEVFELRASASYAFRYYMNDNIDAQTTFAVAIATASTPAGKAILSSLTDLESSRRDPHRFIFAAKFFAFSLLENTHAKDLALSASYTEHGEIVTLLAKICYTLLCAQRDAYESKVRIGLLALLTVWFFDHPASVKEFLTEGPNVQFLVEQINQSSNIDAIEQGLCAFLYGILYRFNDDSEVIFSRNNLHTLLQSRIGADIFVSRVQRLRESKSFNTNDKEMLQDNELLFDPVYLDFLRSNLDSIVKGVTSMKPKSKDTLIVPAEPLKNFEKKLQDALELVKRKDQEIEMLGSCVLELEKALDDQNEELVELRNQSLQLQELEILLKEQALQYKTLEGDHEDLLLLMDEQDEEIKGLKGQ